MFGDNFVPGVEAPGALGSGRMGYVEFVTGGAEVAMDRLGVVGKAVAGDGSGARGQDE